MNQINEYNLFVDTLLEMGRALLACGAETFRCEDTLSRMAKAKGATNINIFVIPSTIIITLKFDEDTVISQSRRIFRANKNDFNKLNQLNHLSRDFCNHPIEASELESKIHQITNETQNKISLCIASFLGASMFAIFFGGNLYDGIIAGIIGILIFYLQQKIAPICMNDLVFNYIAAFISGIIICILCIYIPILHQDKIMIGDIMLLIPGVMATNGIRDLLLRDTLSGIIRVIEACLLAGTLALGFISSIALFGGNIV